MHSSTLGRANRGFINKYGKRIDPMIASGVSGLAPALLATLGQELIGR
jgi:hypothetical protein